MEIVIKNEHNDLESHCLKKHETGNAVLDLFPNKIFNKWFFIMHKLEVYVKYRKTRFRMQLTKLSKAELSHKKKKYFCETLTISYYTNS